MKRFLAALLLCCMLLPCMALAEIKPTPEIPIFDMGRGITFGMTRDEVLALEGAPTNDYDDTLAYHDYALYGKNSTVNYRFNAEYQLESIIIYFEDERHEDANDYIADFDSVDAQLIAQLGEPTLLRSLTWQIDQPAVTEETLASELMSAHVEISTLWTTDAIAYRHYTYKEALTVMHMLTVNPFIPEAE